MMSPPGISLIKIQGYTSSLKNYSNTVLWMIIEDKIKSQKGNGKEDSCPQGSSLKKKSKVFHKLK